MTRSFRARPYRFMTLVVGCAVFSCGGSSSETPPPLEPLPVNLHYDRASTALSGEIPAVEADAGAVVRSEEGSAEAIEGPPARSTWGDDAKPTPLK